MLGAGAAATVLALTAGATSCTPGSPGTDLPRPASRRDRPSPPVPALPGVDSATRREQQLLAATTALLTAANRPGSATARGRVLAQIRTGHAAHGLALATATPTAVPTETTSASGSASSSATPPAATIQVNRALARLDSAEREAAAAYLSLARSNQGVLGLFWASLGCAADSYVRALGSGTAPAPAPLAGPRTQLDPPSEVAATQAMVTQLHAVIYGYQLVIGRLAGSRREPARARLRAHRVLRDQLVEVLVDRVEDVPAAAPAYRPPVRPSDADRAAELVRWMEVALQPWVGRWVAAAARPRERTLAVDTLLATTRAATAWGSSLPVWPGWPD